MFNPAAVKTLSEMIEEAIVLAPESEWPCHGESFELDHTATQAADKFAAENGLYVFWRQDWSDIGEDDRMLDCVLQSITPGMDHTGTIGGEIYPTIIEC